MVRLKRLFPRQMPSNAALRPEIGVSGSSRSFGVRSTAAPAFSRQRLTSARLFFLPFEELTEQHFSVLEPRRGE